MRRRKASEIALHCTVAERKERIAQGGVMLTTRHRHVCGRIYEVTGDG